MAAAEVDMPAPISEQTVEPKATTNGTGADIAHPDRQNIQNGEVIREDQTSKDGGIPKAEEDTGKKGEKTAQTSIRGEALLPSPLPSPRLDGPQIPASFSAALHNENRRPRRTSNAIDTSSDGVGFDSSTGIVSCAVSEADTDAPTSAVESSNEALPFPPVYDGPPTKKPHRNSSAAKRTRDRSGTKSSDHSSIRRLSASKIQELTASPESLPIAPAAMVEQPLSASFAESSSRSSLAPQHVSPAPHRVYDRIETQRSEAFGDAPPSGRSSHTERPTISTRTLTAPSHHQKSGSQSSATTTSRRNSFQPSPRPMPLNLEGNSNFGAHPKSQVPESRNRHEAREPRESRDTRAPSPLPPAFPIPPLSAPTFLQLELAAQRPSPLYVYQSYTSDKPYESSAVKFQRLKNFLFLPPLLERTLIIGALACLDAWLWTLTILPMRFCLALKVLVGWWGYVLAKEVKWVIGFVWEGLGRMWQRGRRGRDISRQPSYTSSKSGDLPSRSPSRVREASKDRIVSGSSTSARRPEAVRMRTGTNGFPLPNIPRARSHRGPFHHRRTKSQPSNLSSFHKADLLQFAVIIVSSLMLTQLDASRMYHFIRAQSAVKLYVIYNLVEASPNPIFLTSDSILMQNRLVIVSCPLWAKTYLNVCSAQRPSLAIVSGAPKSSSHSECSA